MATKKTDEKAMIRQAFEDAYHQKAAELFIGLYENLIACSVPSTEMTQEKAVESFKRGLNLLHLTWELANK